MEEKLKQIFSLWFWQIPKRATNPTNFANPANPVVKGQQPPVLSPFHNTALRRLAVGGLLIGFSKSISPKVRKISESGRIMPFRQGI